MCRKINPVIPFVLVAWLVVSLHATMLSVYAQEPDGYTSYALNMRGGPGTTYTVITQLAPHTGLFFEARNADQAWLLVRTEDGAYRGWVAALYVVLRNGYGSPSALPVSAEIIAALPVVVNPPMADGVTTAPASSVVEQASTIYRHGQQLGNNPHSFILIGDSVDAHSQFFRAFASGNYDLGDYGYLQPTINFFGQSGAFGASYNTSQPGLSSARVLDPTFANPTICNSQESPLDCEYRRKKPSVAIIYLGLNDVLFIPPEHYERDIDHMLQALIDHGVIPVVTTYAIGPEYPYPREALFYHQTLRNLAARYQIPLIELYDTTRALPNSGTDSDSIHLSFRSDNRVVSFAGDQHVYGNTLRELMTLQVLDMIRRDVMGY